jgi:hypothetical protein
MTALQDGTPGCRAGVARCEAHGDAAARLRCQVAEPDFPRGSVFPICKEGEDLFRPLYTPT